MKTDSTAFHNEQLWQYIRETIPLLSTDKYSIKNSIFPNQYQVSQLVINCFRFYLRPVFFDVDIF